MKGNNVEKFDLISDNFVEYPDYLRSAKPNIYLKVVND